MPSKIELAQLPTPLQPMDRLSERYGGPRIWIKRDDLTGCGTTGNKVRKLEFILADVLDKRRDTVITCGGIQSNHCRATAILGAQLGLKTHLLLRLDSPADNSGNLFISRLTGAEITYLDKAEYSKLDIHVKEWLKHYSDRGQQPYFIPTGGSDSLGVCGYINASAELAIDFNENQIAPGAIILATGSGGTQAGLLLGCGLHSIDSQIIGFAVCDDEAYFKNKIQSDMQAWLRCRRSYEPSKVPEILIIDKYKGPRYGACLPEVYDVIKTIARLEGIILDPVYTGKAFYGMLREIERGRFDGVSDIVFVHTGGLFGLLAQSGSVQSCRIPAERF